MRLLITGAGLIGTAVAAAAAARGHDATLVDVAPDREFIRRRAPAVSLVVACDVTDGAGIATVVARIAPDAIVHTAALIGSKVDRAPHLAVAVNVAGAAAVLEAGRRAGVRRIVLVSSLAVYDWPRLPVDRPVHEDSKLGPSSLYGGSKLAAEDVGRTFARRDELDVSFLRLAGTYGPGHFRGGSEIGSMVYRCVRTALTRRRLVAPVALGRREYLHATDAARAVLLDLTTPLRGQRTMNIGTGRVHSRQQFGAALLRALSELVDMDAALDEPIDRTDPVPPLDIALAERIIGYRPSVCLCSGLKLVALGMPESGRCPA